MAGKTPEKAVRAFVSPIQEALGCFADGKVTADTFNVGKEGVLTFNGGAQVTLFGGAHVSIGVSMRYAVVESDDPRSSVWRTGRSVITLGKRKRAQ